MLPSIERLRELFDYEPETGILTHRGRRCEDFRSKQAWQAWQARYAGKAAGWTQKRYLVVTVSKDGRKHKVPAHRLIWALVHGHWPPNDIDHRDGDPLNNRLTNLREATRAENSQNLPPSSTRGTVLDATQRKLRRPWRAYIRVNKKQVWLGCFAAREQAHAAYLAAKAKLHSFQPVPREMVM
jgi:hypothetical protein